MAIVTHVEENACVSRLLITTCESRRSSCRR